MNTFLLWFLIRFFHNKKWWFLISVYNVHRAKSKNANGKLSFCAWHSASVLWTCIENRNLQRIIADRVLDLCPIPYRFSLPVFIMTAADAKLGDNLTPTHVCLQLTNAMSNENGRGTVMIGLMGQSKSHIDRAMISWPCLF